MLQSLTINNVSQTEDNQQKIERELAQQFEAHYDRIYNYLRYRVNAVQDAEDLIGTVYERAYRNRNQFDPNKGAFSTWLFAIARNTLANFYRTRKRHADWVSEGGLPPDLVHPKASPETHIINQEAVSKLLAGVGRLSERDQEVISLKFAGRLSNREIGEIMDMKEKTVSVALVRAMRRLRQQVKLEVAE